MASTQSVTTLLLWERVVVTMRLSPGASCSWNPKAPNPGIPHMVLPRSAPAPSWADIQDHRGLHGSSDWFTYLIVVERLVDDACDGFASVSDTNEDGHIIQESWWEKRVGGGRFECYWTRRSNLIRVSTCRHACWEKIKINKMRNVPCRRFHTEECAEGLSGVRAFVWGLGSRGVTEMPWSWDQLGEGHKHRFTEKEIRKMMKGKRQPGKVARVMRRFTPSREQNKTNRFYQFSSNIDSLLTHQQAQKWKKKAGKEIQVILSLMWSH